MCSSNVSGDNPRGGHLRAWAWRGEYMGCMASGADQGQGAGARGQPWSPGLVHKQGRGSTVASRPLLQESHKCGTLAVWPTARDVR